MRRTRSAALVVAALLTIAPAALTATAATAADPSPSTAPTDGGASSTTSASAAATPAAPKPISSSTSSSSASSSPSTSPTTSPSASTSATPSSSAPAGATLSVRPGSAPRLANVMVEGSCTKIHTPYGDNDGTAQWFVTVVLSIDGKRINDPVQFLTDVSGEFSEPIQLVGTDASTVPAAGDTVAFDLTCSGWDKTLFHLTDEVDVVDTATCPDALPDSTGDLDQLMAESMFNYDGTGTYTGDGWLADSEVMVCHFTNPKHYVQPPQRFGAATAGGDGSVIVSTIGPAVEPTDPDEYTDPADFWIDPPADEEDDYGDDEDEELKRPALAKAAVGDDDATGDVTTDDGDETTRDIADATDVLAVIGTGADGSARVLTADVTNYGVPVSAEGGDPNAPELAATGSNASQYARLGLGLFLTGIGLLIVVRRRDQLG